LASLDFSADSAFIILDKIFSESNISRLSSKVVKQEEDEKENTTQLKNLKEELPRLPRMNTVSLIDES